MADTGDSGFGKFVPGFEFMQNLARQATSGLAQGVQQAAPQLPNLGSWVAPTFSVEDLDKRIQELKTVHFWLDQNSRALAATIQALEVQKMTLATLKGMNVSLGDVANAMKVNTADAMASMAGFAAMAGKSAEPAAPAQPAPEANAPGSAGKEGGTQFAGLEIPPRRPAASAPVPEPVAVPLPPQASPDASPAAQPATVATAPAGSVVDPMQWWGALTQQFQTIATQAMQELPGQSAVEAGKHMASTLASEAVKTATEMTAGVARTLTAQADVVAGAKAADAPAGKAQPKSKAAAAVRPAKAAAPSRTGQRPPAKTPAAKRAPAASSGKATAKTTQAKAKPAAKGTRPR